jgi:pyruvate-ferredoxin/flavodoxin oxidoreductase
MQPQLPLRDSERVNWDYFLTLPDLHKNGLIAFNSVKNVQLLQPLFEFSGACAGCGETPYIKLLTQLFGDRDVPVSTAATCQRRLTLRTQMAVDQRGVTRSSKTMPNSASA